MAARPTLTHELHRHRNAAHRYSELEARLDSHRRSTSDLTKFLQGLEGGEGHDGEERDGLARLLARLEGHASSFDATTSQLATERQRCAARSPRTLGMPNRRRLRVLERVDEVVCEATNPTRGSDVEYAPEVDEPTLEAPRAAGPAAGPRRAQDALLTSQSTPMVGSEPAQAVEARRASLEPESRKPALAQFRKVVRAMTAIRNFSPKTPSQPVPPIKMDGGTTFDVQMLQRTPSRLQRAFLDEARGDEAPQGDGGATRARATSACASREDAGGPFDDLRPRASSSRSRASTSRPSASRPRTFFDEAPTAEEVCGGEAKTEEARPEWPEWPSEALSPESHEDARWLDTESVGSENDAVDANASFYCRRAFNPEALVYWDYFMTALILIYACFYDTYRKTFMYDRGSRVLGNLLDFVFAVDMCISAQTAFTANGYSLVTDRKKVFVHYLTTWFAVDFASTVPWDSVAMWFGRPRTPILQILSLVRVFRVLRAPRIIHRMTLDWTIHTVKLAFVIYAIFTLLVAHLLGCLFWLAPDVFPSRGGSGLSWKEFNGLTRFEEQRQYLNCLYWAITTMTTLGYGDLAPRLEAEMVIAVFAEIIGATAFALLVMHIQKLYDVLIEDDGNNVRQRNDLAVYLDQMHVRRSLKGKVMRYLSYKAHTHSYTSFNDADPRMSGLTPALKLELRLEIFRPILARNAVFSNVPEAALNAMARHIVSRPCSPGEFFIERGAYGTHCAFLLAGKLKIVDGGGQDFKVVRATDANNVVAITSLLDDDVHASLQSLMKQLSAQAVDHCSLAIICRADFRNHVLKVWPDGDKILLEMLAESTGLVAMSKSQTVSVGGIPEAQCNAEWLGERFGAFGGIASMSFHARPPADGAHASWAVISFWSSAGAEAAAAHDDHRVDEAKGEETLTNQRTKSQRRRGYKQAGARRSLRPGEATPVLDAPADGDERSSLGQLSTLGGLSESSLDLPSFDATDRPEHSPDSGRPEHSLEHADAVRPEHLLEHAATERPEHAIEHATADQSDL